MGRVREVAAIAKKSWSAGGADLPLGLVGFECGAAVVVVVAVMMMMMMNVVQMSLAFAIVMSVMRTTRMAMVIAEQIRVNRRW